MIPVPYQVSLSPRVIFQELKGEAVLLDLEKEVYFGLDEVATALWRQLQHNPDLNAACESMLGEFAVEPVQLQRDIFAFLTQLVDAGLVCISPAFLANDLSDGADTPPAG